MIIKIKTKLMFYKLKWLYYKFMKPGTGLMESGWVCPWPAQCQAWLRLCVPLCAPDLPWEDRGSGLLVLSSSLRGLRSTNLYTQHQLNT